RKKNKSSKNYQKKSKTQKEQKTANSQTRHKKFSCLSYCILFIRYRSRKKFNQKTHN
uniref:Uncharacterized protein n=1 Tax=Amphimedon queenslandica TaxID=400682 RepID=A0A1X7UZ22_AMPQE